MEYLVKFKQIMKQTEPDETDLQLLDLLQRDAGLSNVALAERLHLSPPTCLAIFHMDPLDGAALLARNDQTCHEPGLRRLAAGPASEQREGHLEVTQMGEG